MEKTFSQVKDSKTCDFDYTLDILVYTQAIRELEQSKAWKR